MRVTDGPLVTLAALAIGCGSNVAPGAVPGPDAGESSRGAALPSNATPASLLETLSPAVLPSPPADVSNRHADDAQAAALGQALFFDPSFSGPLLDLDNDGKAGTLGRAGDTGRVACAGCHVPASGFLDSRSPDKQISLAAGWGSRKAPSLLDVGQDKLVMWDGRHDTLYDQVFGPIESPLEMNSSRLFVAEQLARNYRAQYEAVFGAMPAFDDPQTFPPLSAKQSGCHPKYPGSPKSTCDGTSHGMPGDGAEYDGLSAEGQQAVTLAVVNMGKAIGAYERKLACGPSRFDRWMHGEGSAMDASEQRGAALFVGKAACVSCHSGPYLSDQKFHDVGLEPKPVGVVFADLSDTGASGGIAAAIADPLNIRSSYSDGDDGRLPTSVAPQLEGSFKTPMLRCVSLRPSFMHTAQIRTLAQTVAFFNRGGDGPGIYGQNELRPLGLSAQEQEDLVNFLGALTGPGPDSSLQQPP
jgi:cytochrome c peroxidase